MAVNLQDACAEILAMPANQTVTVPVEWLKVLVAELHSISEHMEDDLPTPQPYAGDIAVVESQLEAVL